MARRPYNDLADVFTGPNTPTPGVFKFTTPCRLVLAQYVSARTQPFNSIIGYITHGPPIVSAGGWNTVVGGFEFFVEDGDVMSLQGIPGSAFQVWIRERITPLAGGPYFRAWVS